VRFTCPKCGKKYASSSEPAPGKAYRLRCEACGEPIVLRAGAVVGSAPTPPPGASAVPRSSATGAPEARSAAAPTPIATETKTATATPASTATPTEPSTAPAAEPSESSIPSVSSSSVIPIPTGTPTPGPPSPAPPPKPEEGPLDLGLSLTPTPGEVQSLGDPFAAAARASLPADYGAAAGGAAPDPIAALGRDPSAAPPRREPVAPSFSSIRKPAARRPSAILLLLAAGFAVVLGVLAFAIVKGKMADGAAGQRAPAAQRQATP